MLLQIDIVCDVQNAIANIILYLRRNIEEKYFITKKGKQLGKYWENCVGEKVWIYEKKKYVQIMYICRQRYHFKGLHHILWKKAYRMIEQFHELKYKYTNREFWCKGYYVDTVAKMQIIYRELREHLILQLEKENFFKGSK